jgi:microcystin-dependent protein
MPYTVNYTDESQSRRPITVFDNTSNTDTSLVFPGRNVTGYGQTIAENFLHLLENFSNSNPPVNPTRGQIWFNSNPEVLSLLIWDGSNWKAASGVQKSPVEPPTEQTKVGELWVDTINQQLYVFSGIDWILVGPNFSTGLRSGLVVEQVTDSADINRVILSVYVEDRPIIIISKDSFTPKTIIPQFSTIRSGVNVAAPNTSIEQETSIYQGGFLPRVVGTASSADALNVAGISVESNKFLRTDIVNVVENSFNVKNDAGITFGADGTFNISTSTTAAKLWNTSAGSGIDLQITDSGIPTTVLRVIDNKVGINVLSPRESLDIQGNFQLRGRMIVTDDTASTNLNNGSIQTAGGLAVGSNAIIGQSLEVRGVTTSNNIVPSSNETYTLGSDPSQGGRRWDKIFSKEINADIITGQITGSITGNAATATRLQNPTQFRMIGDVSSLPFDFNGITGGTTKTFDTSIATGFITSKQDVSILQSPQKNYSLRDDSVLIFRASVSGLLKANRDTFVGDLGIPIGGILPYAGTAIPFGFLLCDGSEVLIAKHPELFQAIGITYNGASPLIGFDTFRLPDLRARFPLGRDNMDNGGQVATPGGAIVDAGGGNVDRISGIEPDTLGGSGGAGQYALSISNLPEHEHDMQGSTNQRYYATRLDTTVPLDTGAFLGAGGTTPNRVQYLPSSGGIKLSAGEVIGQPYPVVNPFLTINYIIRTGAPAF